MLHTRDIGRIRVTRKGRIVSSSNPHLVCRQVNREFTESLPGLPKLVRATGQNIVCEVHDFNFKPLMTFLNHMIKSLILTVFVDNIAYRLGPIVKLSISKAWCKDPNIESLIKWSRWLRRNEKEMTHFATLYQIGEVEDVDLADEVLNLLVDVESPNPEMSRMVSSFNAWYTSSVTESAEEQERKIVEDGQAVCRYARVE